MSFFTHAKASRAAAKVAEELIYEQVAAEVAAGAIRQGLWAKAIAESDGNEAAAKARYIKLRVELLIAEAELAEHAVKQATKRAAKESAREAQERLRMPLRPRGLKGRWRIGRRLRRATS